MAFGDPYQRLREWARPLLELGRVGWPLASTDETAGFALVARGLFDENLDFYNFESLGLSGGLTSVRAHGAKGDGTTDDRAAIQAAIDYAIARGLRAVIFPPGTYKLSSFTDSSEGGYRCHLLFGNTTGSAISLSLIGQGAVLTSDKKEASVKTTFIGARNWSDSVVSGLEFRSTVATAGSVVNNSGNLDGIYYMGQTAPGCPGSNVTIQNCKFVRCSQSVHWVGESITSSTPAAFTNLTVRKSVFSHPEGQDTAGQTAIRIGTTDIQWINVEDNYHDGCDTGTCGSVGRPKDGFIITHGVCNKITGNTIRRFSYESVALFAYGTTVHPYGTKNQDIVANNLFQNPDTTGDTTGAGGYAVTVQRPNVTVIGNTFQEVKRGVQTSNLTSYTTTQDLTMPAVGGTVTVNVSDNSKLVIGELVYVADSIFELMSKPTGQAELRNVGSVGNVLPGAVISSGASLIQPFLYAANLTVADNQFVMQGGTFNQLWAIQLVRSEGARIVNNEILFPVSIGDLGSNWAMGIGVQLTRHVTIQGNRVRSTTLPAAGPVHGIFCSTPGPRNAYIGGNRFENLTSGVGGLASGSGDSVVEGNYFFGCTRNVMASVAGGANAETGAFAQTQILNWIPTATGWHRITVSGAESASGRLTVTADSYYGVASGSAPAAGTTKFTDVAVEFSGSKLDTSTLKNSLRLLRYFAANSGMIDAVRLVYDSTGTFLEVNVSESTTFRPIVLRLDTAQRGVILREPIADPGGSTVLKTLTLSMANLPTTTEAEEVFVQFSIAVPATAADAATWTFTPANVQGATTQPFAVAGKFIYLKEVNIVVNFDTDPVADTFSISLNARNPTAQSNSNTALSGMAVSGLTVTDTGGAAAEHVYRFRSTTVSQVPSDWVTAASSSGILPLSSLVLTNLSGGSLTIMNRSVYGFVRLGVSP